MADNKQINKSGTTNPGINPINRSSQTSNVKGIDLSPIITLNNQVQGLNKNLDSFIAKMNEVSNNIVNAISSQKQNQSNSQQQNSQKNNERIEDINAGKNDGTVDFNRNIQSYIKKIADNSTIVVENFQLMQNNIISSINNKSQPLSENLVNQISNISNQADVNLTDEQKSILDYFNPQTVELFHNNINNNFSTMIERQNQIITALTSSLTSKQIQPSVNNQMLTNSFDESRMKKTADLLNEKINSINQPLRTNVTTTQQITTKNITNTTSNINNEQQLTGYKVNPLKKLESIAEIPNLTNYFSNIKGNTAIDTSKSAVLGNHMSAINEPTYIKSRNKQSHVIYETDGGKDRKTTPLYDFSELTSLLVDIDIKTSNIDRKIVSGGDLLSQQKSQLNLSKLEDVSPNKASKSKLSKLNDVLHTPLTAFKENNKKDSDDVDIEDGEEHYTKSKKDKQGLFSNLFKTKSNNDKDKKNILEPGSTIAAAQTSGLGLLLLSLYKQQAVSSSKSNNLLENLITHSSSSGKDLSSLSKLLMDESAKKASAAALGNLGEGGGDSSGLSGVISGGDVDLSKLANATKEKGDNVDLSKLANLGKVGKMAKFASWGGKLLGGGVKGLLHTTIGGDVGSGLVMGALVGTAAVLATKLGVLAFRGKQDQQQLQQALRDRNAAITETNMAVRRSKQFQVRQKAAIAAMNKKDADRNALDMINVEKFKSGKDNNSKYATKDYANKIAKISTKDLADKKMSEKDLQSMDETLKKQIGTNNVEFLTNIQQTDDSLDDAANDAKQGSYDNEKYWLTESEVNAGKTFDINRLQSLMQTVNRKIAMATKERDDAWGPAIQAKRAISNLTVYKSKLQQKIRQVQSRNKANEEFNKQRENIQKELDKRKQKEEAERKAFEARKRKNNPSVQGDIQKKDVEKTPADELLNDMKDQMNPEEYKKLQEDLKSEDPKIRQAAEQKIKEMYAKFQPKEKKEDAQQGLKQQGAKTNPQQQIDQSKKQLDDQDKQKKQQEAAEAAAKVKAEQEKKQREEQQAKYMKKLAENSEKQATALQKTADNSSKPTVKVTQVIPSSNNLNPNPIVNNNKV